MDQIPTVKYMCVFSSITVKTECFLTFSTSTPPLSNVSRSLRPTNCSPVWFYTAWNKSFQIKFSHLEFGKLWPWRRKGWEELSLYKHSISAVSLNFNNFYSLKKHVYEKEKYQNSPLNNLIKLDDTSAVTGTEPLCSGKMAERRMSSWETQGQIFIWALRIQGQQIQV